MKILVLCLLLSAGSIQVFSELFINELMPAPVGEPEWIELLSCNKELRLSEYTLADLTSVKSLPDTLIPPNTFIVITNKPEELLDVRDIPSEAMIIICTIPSLNNTEDALVLTHIPSGVKDSIYYTSSDYEKGLSIERADVLSEFCGENITVSTDKSGASCGYKNSNKAVEFDLVICSAQYNSIDKTISIVIRNTGKRKADGALFKVIYNDLSIFIKEISPLDYNDSLRFIIPYNEIEEHVNASGAIEITTLIEYLPDEKPDNNVSQVIIYKSSPKREVLINEILFDVDENNYEFIELYNISEKDIDLSGWRIYDEAAGCEKAIVTQDFVIKAMSYSLVAWNEEILAKFSYLLDSANYYISSTKLSLNNSGDKIYIADPNGMIMDSLIYSDKWHEESQAFTDNISLEKISPQLPTNLPESWTSSASAAGSTPGAKNSVYVDYHFTGRLSASPNPFSPTGNSIENRCIIKYELPFTRGRLIAKIFTNSGIQILELENNQYTASEGMLIWDGKDSDGYIVQPGAYILYLEAVNLEKDETFYDKILIVVGEN